MLADDRSQVGAVDTRGFGEAELAQTPHERHAIRGGEVRLVHELPVFGPLVRLDDVVHRGYADVAGLSEAAPFDDPARRLVVVRCIHAHAEDVAGPEGVALLEP